MIRCRMPSFRELMFGGDPDKVELPEELEEAQRQREALRAQVQREAIGGAPTAGALAIREAGRVATEQAGQQAMGRAAGTRGFARLAADASAGAEASQAEQKTLGQAILAEGQQQAADVAQSRKTLAELIAEEERMSLLRDQMRRDRASPGLAPLIGTGLGALAGAAIGSGGGPAGAKAGAKLGAQYGGTAGAGLASQFRP